MTDDRAVAGMIDFLTAIVIVVGTIVVFFTTASALLDVQRQGGDAVDRVGVRANERLVDDALVAGPEEDVLAAGCSRAFFGTSPNRSCSITADGDGQSYLRGVLGLDAQYRVNVTVEGDDGVLRTAHRPSADPYRHAVGPAVPPDRTVAVYTRVVSYGTDDDGDGHVDYYTLTVSVWEGR